MTSETCCRGMGFSRRVCTHKRGMTKEGCCRKAGAQKKTSGTVVNDFCSRWGLSHLVCDLTMVLLPDATLQFWVCHGLGFWISQIVLSGLSPVALGHAQVILFTQGCSATVWQCHGWSVLASTEKDVAKWHLRGWTHTASCTWPNCLVATVNTGTGRQELPGPLLVSAADHGQAHMPRGGLAVLP